MYKEVKKALHIIGIQKHYFNNYSWRGCNMSAHVYVHGKSSSIICCLLKMLWYKNMQNSLQNTLLQILHIFSYKHKILIFVKNSTLANWSVKCMWGKHRLQAYINFYCFVLATLKCQYWMCQYTHAAKMTSHSKLSWSCTAQCAKGHRGRHWRNGLCTVGDESKIPPKRDVMQK